MSIKKLAIVMGVYVTLAGALIVATAINEERNAKRWAKRAEEIEEERANEKALEDAAIAELGDSYVDVSKLYELTKGHNASINGYKIHNCHELLGESVLVLSPDYGSVIYKDGLIHVNASRYHDFYVLVKDGIIQTVFLESNQDNHYRVEFHTQQSITDDQIYGRLTETIFKELMS
jgi:hypothetical protein